MSNNMKILSIDNVVIQMLYCVLDDFKTKYSHDFFLLLLCRIAYESPVEITKILLGLPVVPESIKIIYDKETDTEGFSFVMDDALYFIFRGTEFGSYGVSWKDIWSDIRFIKTPYKYGGYLHAGFNKAGMSVKKRCLEIATEARSKHGVDIVYVSGHSLGAKVAEVISDAICVDGPFMYMEANPVTFGCPGGMSKDLAKEFNIRHPGYRRYENTRDLIANVPRLFSYWAGEEIKLKGKKGCRGHRIDKYITNFMNKIGTE